MYEEKELLPLSGLQHIVFCERQCALIHVEKAWRDNVLTAQGKILHEKVHAGGGESRHDVRVVRGLALCSRRLGLAGQADVVELHREPDSRGVGAAVPGLPGKWRPFPIEYKRGAPKWLDCDRVQLCAQAICLEEMLAAGVPRGALFYGTTRRREEVVFDKPLRARTAAAAARFHEIVATGATPFAWRMPKCRSCSLLTTCMPPTARRRPAAQYLERALATALEST